MAYTPNNTHNNATEGGRLGRILLTADLESLAPALPRECLRDLLASIVSVADATGALLNYLDPAVVGNCMQTLRRATWLALTRNWHLR